MLWGMGCLIARKGGGGGLGFGNTGGAVVRHEGGHVPLAGTCVQVVMTREPTSHVVVSTWCPSGGLAFRPADASVAIDGESAKTPGWCDIASNT